MNIKFKMKIQMKKEMKVTTVLKSQIISNSKLTKLQKKGRDNKMIMNIIKIHKDKEYIYEGEDIKEEDYQKGKEMYFHSSL